MVVSIFKKMFQKCPAHLLLLLFRIVSSTTTSTEQIDAGETARCQMDKLKSGTEMIECQNATSDFFRATRIPFDRAHLFVCRNCSLPILDETTFDFAAGNRVTFVKLSGNQIKRLNRFAFNRLPSLKQLILNQNRIQDVRPGAFDGINKLLQLDLSRNRLSKLINKSFHELANLDVLNLNENWINIIEEDAFFGLSNLKYLYLNRNKLYTLDSNAFRYLYQLKILYLEHNRIKELHPLSFNNLINLNYLYLNNNSINYLVQYNFKSLINLIDLQMSFNNLIELQTSSFNGLNNLKYLYLSYNRIERVKPYGLIGLNNLLLLDLIGNKFANFTLDYLKDMENLQILWLRNNSMSNFTIPSNSDQLNSLQVIDLLNNRLGRFDFKLLLYKVPNLNEILLNKEFLSCDFFIDIYDYYLASNNVTICLDENCRKNATDSHLTDVCLNYENTTIIDFLPTDYVLNRASFHRLNPHHCSILFVIIAIIVCYYF